jgi:hypothetical protein
MKKAIQKILTIVFISCLSAGVYGNVYVVTSNVNGTTTDSVSLRWAITQANTNPGADTIKFDIPGISPHTITLTTALPSITGINGIGTVIDGTSQPANGFGGVSPKIIINGNGAVSTGLMIQSSSCAIYGLYITRFTQIAVQFMPGANAFKFGAPGRGNVVNNTNQFGQGIAAANITIGSIKANKIGTDTTGLFAASNYTGISMNNCVNIQIGGNGLGEGNLISGQSGPNSENIIMSGCKNIIIYGNIIGPDKNGNRIPTVNTNDGIYLISGDTNCIIGGSLQGQPNIIAYNIDTSNNIGAGIQIQNTCIHNLFSENKIYCNGDWGGIQNLNGNDTFPVPVITSAYLNTANGTARNNSLVELFYNHSGCSSNVNGCSGETYIGAVNTNNTGQWTYSGVLTGGAFLTATARDTNNNNTSSFGNCIAIAMTTGIPETSQSSPFIVYPNPFNDITYVVVDENLLQMNCYLNLFDITGRDVQTVKLNEHISKLERGNLPDGVYFYRIVNSNGLIGNGKLVIN